MNAPNRPGDTHSMLRAQRLALQIAVQSAELRGAIDHHRNAHGDCAELVRLERIADAAACGSSDPIVDSARDSTREAVQAGSIVSRPLLEDIAATCRTWRAIINDRRDALRSFERPDPQPQIDAERIVTQLERALLGDQSEASETPLAIGASAALDEAVTRLYQLGAQFRGIVESAQAKGGAEGYVSDTAELARIGAYAADQWADDIDKSRDALVVAMGGVR